MRRLTKMLFLMTFSLTGLLTSTVAQANIGGYWEGVIADAGRELRFNVEFRVEFNGEPNQLKGRIDVPDLYIFDYALANVRYESGKIHFELPLGREPEQFEGVLTNENIAGKYSGRFYKEELHPAIFRLWREHRDVRYTRESVTFSSGPSGEVKLAGTLFVPLKKGAHPAIVFFHGSGPQTRESYLRYFADLFARRGFATLIYDKRGAGESTGPNWYRTGDNFANLVADALSGVQFLCNRNDIDRRRVGLWGLSQGGWLAPLAASRSQDIAFLIAISGGGVTPAEQELYDDEVKLRDRGFTEDQISQAVALLKMADDVIRKKVNWEDFAAARTRAQQQPWYPLLDRFPLKLPRDDGSWLAGSAQLDFDPRPVWQQVKVPVFAIFGEADKSTPSPESARRIELALKQGGNKHYRVEVVPDADHGLWVASKPGRWDWDRPAPGWVEKVARWAEKQ